MKRTLGSGLVSLASLVALVAASAACGSSADPIYYAMATVPGHDAKVAAPRVVEVRRPGIAGYLDRSDIVGRVADYRLRTKLGERWGEPFGDMIGRVLAADLSMRLPGPSVFREEAALTADVDARVEVDVQRFDAGDDGELVLLAQVAVVRDKPQRVGATRSVTLRARPDGNGTSALVGAMSALLGQLADQVAMMLRQDPAPVAREP